MLKTFLKHIEQNNLFKKQDRLLIAISGGADSVVLTHLCREAGFRITLAHCNFGLRGEESVRDENFVRKLAADWNLPLEVKHFNTVEIAEKEGRGIQETARNLRYEWFHQLTDPGSKEAVADFVLTAHHADDNIETLLINFFRGTGLRGLGGIPPKNGRLVRPLLFVHRAKILDYIRAHGLEYVEDSSNLSDKYTRNNFRLNILPAIRDMFPEVDHNLTENIRRFRESLVLYERELERLKKKLLIPAGNDRQTPVLLLKQQPALHTLVHELYGPFGFTPAQTQDIIHLLDAPSGKQVIAPEYRIIRHRKWLVLAPAAQQESSIQVWDDIESPLVFPTGTLEASLKEHTGELKKPDTNNIALLDATSVKFPLVVRRWKTGDYFYPQGLGKKKKISRFLIDQKLALNEKENVFVIESAGRIIWVIGRRIDDRCAVRPSTKQILTIRLI